MKINMKLLCLLTLLICTLILSGCERNPKPALDNNSDVTLELSPEQAEPPKETAEPATSDGQNSKKEESQHQSPDEKIEQSRPEAPKTEPSQETKPNTETPAPETQTPAAESSPSPAAPATLDLPAELQTRPDKELSSNPQHLDTRLYAVFKNVMEQNFARKKGTLNVYRLNFDGTEGAYELQFDLSGAYDKEGNLNKKGPVDANMKIAETLQSGVNYGQGSRETYNTYEQYAQTLAWLQSPLLADGFTLENFSKLALTAEDGHYMIEATYSPAALKKLYEQEIDGIVQAFIQVDKQGTLEVLGWEQTEVIDDYPTKIASADYRFS